MNRPFHKILDQALDAAPIWDWSNTGIDVPADLFDVLIAEGAEEKGLSPVRARVTSILFGACSIFVECRGPSGCLTVHCQGLDCYTHHLSAHDRLRIAAFRAKTDHFPSKNQSPAPDGRD